LKENQDPVLRSDMLKFKQSLVLEVFNKVKRIPKPYVPNVIKLLLKEKKNNTESGSGEVKEEKE
jgi:hypothetical protein